MATVDDIMDAVGIFMKNAPALVGSQHVDPCEIKELWCAVKHLLRYLDGLTSIARMPSGNATGEDSVKARQYTRSVATTFPECSDQGSWI
jgi:hypothetical protein